MRLILTGSTGMVGEAVLLECLKDPSIEQVLLINRKPCGHSDPKIKEIIHGDFFNLTPLEGELRGFDACLFCLGISSIGVDEAAYTKTTYELTLHLAKTVLRVNPDMSFVYISGAGTDSSEKGRLMWARVKGKTENDLFKMPFNKAYAFRPGMLKPSPGQKHVLPSYKYVAWLYPVIATLFPQYACSLETLGKAMIAAAKNKSDKQILEVRDIRRLAKNAES